MDNSIMAIILNVHYTMEPLNKGHIAERLSSSRRFIAMGNQYCEVSLVRGYPLLYRRFYCSGYQYPEILMYMSRLSTVLRLMLALLLVHNSSEVTL